MKRNSQPVHGHGNRPLFRLLTVNGIAGAALGILFVLAILALDIGGIRTLLVATGDWAIALPLLTMGSVVTFASVAMGGAIMLIPTDDRGPPVGPGLRVNELVPVRVHARMRRPRHPAD